MAVKTGTGDCQYSGSVWLRCQCQCQCQLLLPTYTASLMQRQSTVKMNLLPPSEPCSHEAPCLHPLVLAYATCCIDKEHRRLRQEASRSIDIHGITNAADEYVPFGCIKREESLCVIVSPSPSLHAFIPSPSDWTSSLSQAVSLLPPMQSESTSRATSWTAQRLGVVLSRLRIIIHG